MSNFNFRGATIESVRFDHNNNVVVTISAWRGEEGETRHVLEIRCCPGAVHRLMGEYVEACNRELESAEQTHLWNKERVANAWNAFKRTAGEVKP
jgi:hypothetical protein